MQVQSKFAITPIAAAVTAAIYPGYSALAQDDQSEDFALEEIIVTATKRTMSTQDIPATVQAITQESLASMGAKGMDDYARFIPSVNVVTYGAGSSTVVFRGAITGAGYIAQSTSSVYLDEISITNTGSQPQIRLVDIARVEALSGPQGTLYGSDAQAGTLRIITNQPVMNHYEAIFDGEVRGGEESDMSYRGSLTFNIPLVEDKLASRDAAYQDEDGGFIDNVFGHTADSGAFGQTWESRPGTERNLYENHGVLNNQAVVEENWNEAEITGARAHLRWEMSDDWSLTGTAFTQATDSGGGNYYDPFVGDLEVVRFHNDYREEDFNMYSMVLEGDLGFAQIVAAASYYEREIYGLDDITNYAHYWSAQYCHDGALQAGAYILDPAGGIGQGDNDTYYLNYQFAYYFGNPETGYYVWAAYCQGQTVDSDFFSTYEGPSQDDKFTTEIRLSSQGDTFDWIVGFYYEETTDSWQAPFATPTTGGDGSEITFQTSVAAAFWENYFANYYGSPGAPIPSPNLAGSTSNWYSESLTEWEQTAVFGEISWHMTDSLNLTLGGRYFERDSKNYYIVNHPGGSAPTGGFGTNGEPDFFDGEDWPLAGSSPSRQARLAAGLDNPIARLGEDKEFIPKISLSWGMTDDVMMYGLYTQGKRPGGVNRSRGQPAFPNQYSADIMDNYEMGYKSNFGDGRGRFNVTAYYMLWSDYQLEQVDPASTNCIDPNTGLEDDSKIPFVCGQPWQQVVGNAGEAHIAGVNVELDYALSENWVIGGNFEAMQAEVDTPQDTDNDGIPNLTAGLKLPLVPEFKTSAWLEYSAPSKLFGSENWFFRTQWSVTGESLNILEPLPTDDPNPQFKNDAYTIGDVRVGLVGESWEASVFVNNVTDERATYTHGTGLFEWAQAQSAEGRAHHQTLYVNRPLEVGVRFMYRWGN